MAYVQLYPSHEHREDYQPLCEKQQAIGVTQQSLAEAVAATRAERIRNGFDPDNPVPVVTHQPLRQWPPLSHRVNCADALDCVIEKHGLRAVLLALANVCSANGFDVCRQTISDLAQIAEQQ